MNGLQVLRTVTDALTFDQVLRLDIEKTGVGIQEQKNIDPKQITNGSSTVDIMQYMVPAQLADKLNSIPNPDRNGLILLWSYNLHRIFNGSDGGVMDFLAFLYRQGNIQYSSQQRKPKKLRDQTNQEGSEFVITVDSLGLTVKKPESMTNTSDSEYERLRRFVVQCMLPSMSVFQQRWASTVINKTVDLQVLSHNLLKGFREIIMVSQID